MTPMPATPAAVSSHAQVLSLDRVYAMVCSKTSLMELAVEEAALVEMANVQARHRVARSPRGSMITNRLLSVYALLLERYSYWQSWAAFSDAAVCRGRPSDLPCLWHHLLRMVVGKDGTASRSHMPLEETTIMCRRRLPPIMGAACGMHNCVRMGFA